MTGLSLALALAAWAAGSEGLLPEASEQVRRLETLADLAASPSSVGRAGWVSPEAAAAYCSSSPMTIAALPERDRELLYACSAYVHRDPGPCRAMPAAFISRSSENCLTSFENMSFFIDLAAPSSTSVSICNVGFGRMNPRLSQEEREKACAALARPGTVASRCAAYREQVPRAFLGLTLKECADDVTLFMTGRGCEGFHPGSNQRVLCPAFAAFRKGRCGSDYLCRALKGDARACDDERSVQISSACVQAALAGGNRDSAPASPLLRREIADTLSWAVYLPVLDQGGRGALSRLHGMMLGRRAFDPGAAIADLLSLRAGGIEDLLYRAGQLSASAPDGPEARAVKELRRRFDKARGRITRRL